MKGNAWAWERARALKISPTARLVLLSLVERAGLDGRCWPSQSCIADDCGLSERAVHDALKLLESDATKLIVRQKRARHGKRVSDLITVQFSAVTLFPNGPEQPDDPEDFGSPEADETVVEDVSTKSAVGDDPDDSPPAANAVSAPQMAPKPPAADAAQNPPEESRKKNPEGEERAPEGLASPSESRVEPDIDILAARIFDAGSDAHRSKCGNDPGKIRFALRDAKSRGYDPVQVTEAMVAMLTSADQAREGGRFAVGPHRAIDDDRWRNWIGRPAGSPASRAHAGASAKPTLATVAGEIEFEGRTWAIPVGGQLHKIGTAEAPGIQRQLSIMDRWRPPRRLIDWNEAKWGPPPGAPQCRLWPSVLENFSHESTGAQG